MFDGNPPPTPHRGEGVGGSIREGKAAEFAAAEEDGYTFVSLAGEWVGYFRRYDDRYIQAAARR